MPQETTRHLTLTPNSRLALVLVIGLLATGLASWSVMRPAEPGQAFRSLLDVSPVYWIQILTGFGALAISGWVWALRPRDTAARLFALSGLATLTFTYAPIPFRFAQAAISEAAATSLIVMNAVGASFFGIVMVVLFINYPARLPAHRILTLAAILIFGGWTLLGLAVALSSGSFSGLNLHLITVLEMLLICVAVAAQILVTDRDPKARAVAIWFGLAVLFGAGSFITLTAIPGALGRPPIVQAQYSFAFFLLIYIGVAAGLRQFRLFELGDWAYRILFYVAGAVLLLVLDGVLVSLISLEPASAFGLSLLAVALVYLPLRDLIGRRLLPKPGLKEDELFLSVVDIAFGTSDRDRHARWRALLDKLFSPLEISTGSQAVAEPELAEDGVALHLPERAGHPGLVLRYPWQGRALFSPRHVAMVRQLVELMARAEESRQAYDRGVAEERGRIARDMHDNIGAQLLGALHSGDRERKDVMIRETLTDLRDIINNASTPGLDLDETLADLRVETADRLASVGITLDWQNTIGQAPDLSTSSTHALRSIVREAVSNTIRHSGASQLAVRLSREGDLARLEITDDGKGYDIDAQKRGNGLSNMQTRATGLAGTLEMNSGDTGTRITLDFALSPREVRP
ncbi:sensor histidine kinase [Maricaulis parjimensis]|uniref:sensor histidine kinase n=1 Tax=Maricaulis parjimensis TaxID=144023 RepID=UPI001939DE52|nr:ATP-binding protein [Maricaulis parjimensis]